MRLQNSKGKVWYGMHFYPGVAEYQEPGKEPYRVFLNENTLREMDPSFAGRPLYIEHVDEVPDSLNKLKHEADGWVIESFFNTADGKHWVKFITVSDEADRAIAKGFRLSNSYFPRSFKEGGLWNGVQYAQEIIAGEFEHLALVRNPRYEESVVMTPEEFKLYNEQKVSELKRIANSKSNKEKPPMKWKLFKTKREKVENSADLEGMSIVLEKSGVEIEISKLINDADELEVAKKKNEVMADPEHKVKMHDGSMCNVGELVAKHKELHDALEEMKGKKEDSDEDEEEGLEEVPEHVDVEGDKHNDDDEGSDDDKDAKKKALQLAEHEEKEIVEAKKKNALEKAKALRNASPERFALEETAVVELMQDQVARGKTRYGS